MMGGGDDNSNQPYPDIRSALTLTLLAMLAAAFTSFAFIDFGLLAAVGIGQAIGVGAVATMGAQRVAEPQAVRLGLRALDWKDVPAILCLAPAILLVSELDNVAADWAGSDSPEEIASSINAIDGIDAGSPIQNDFDAGLPNEPRPGEGELAASRGDPKTESTKTELDLERPLIDPEDPWSLLAAFVVMAGISPLVEEFLFRGVIQQGLVQRFGLVRGVTAVALLWTLLRPAPIAGFARFFAAAIASFGLGWALGIVRIATGSILGSILLASSWAAISLFAIGFADRVELPGMNVDGTHLPWSVTLGSLVIVGWIGWTIYQQAETRFRADSTPPPE